MSLFKSKQRVADHGEVFTGKGVLYVTHSKNETSKRPIPLNQAARDAVERMLKRADALGHAEPSHYLWCASQHHKFDPTKPALKWDTAWRALRDAAGLPGFRFHDLRHTSSRTCSRLASQSTSLRRSPGTSRGGCWSTIHTSGSRPRTRCLRGWRSGEKGRAPKPLAV